MSNNRITADYEFFCELAVVTATSPSRRRSFDRYKRDSTEIWLFDVPVQYLEEEAFK